MRAHRAGAATVLVVEDDTVINMAAVDAIRDQGYLVLSATNADDALLILAAHSEIDLLFTDIRMPGSINGLMLAGVVRRTYPSMTIIIASGNVHPPRDQMPAHATFLPKPYNAGQIAGALRNLLISRVAWPAKEGSRGSRLFERRTAWPSRESMN